jgi:hypothetical protein
LACHQQVFSDPEGAYHFDADPDPAYQIDADPDLNPTFQFGLDPDPPYWFVGLEKSVALPYF